jgi:spermidine synthase
MKDGHWSVLWVRSMTIFHLSLLLLSILSGTAALIYELVWFQLLELTMGSTAVSLAVILATFMGGTCLGSLMLPRFLSTCRLPLRVYGAIEAGIGTFGVLVLLVMPSIGALYTAWSGFGWKGFLVRGVVAAVCLLPPTLLMGATLPTLSRRIQPMAEGVSWLGLFYGGNIMGGVFGCLLAGFYLLRNYDVAVATYVAVAINALAATLAILLTVNDETVGAVSDRPFFADFRKDGRSETAPTVLIAIAASGFCALAAEAIWTRLLGLLLGASVYTFSIILAVFLSGLGIGSGIGSLLCRNLRRPRIALGLCQLLGAAAIAWAAYNLSASLPYWPIDPSISSNLRFNFEVDLARAFWVLLPPTLVWGASFPLALAAGASQQYDSVGLMARIYAANTFGAIGGALAASVILVAWIGSPQVQQLLIGISMAAGLLLILPEARTSAAAGLLFTGALVGGLLMNSVPPLENRSSHMDATRQAGSARVTSSMQPKVSMPRWRFPDFQTMSSPFTWRERSRRPTSLGTCVCNGCSVISRRCSPSNRVRCS